MRRTVSSVAAAGAWALAWASLFAPTAKAVESEPVSKVKLCNPAETLCTEVTAGNRAKVDADVTSSVLPSGASTSSLQTTGNSSLSSIDTKTPALVSGRQPVDGSGVTQPISAASLPLPSGASTSALQTTGNTSLASIDTKTPALVSGRQPVDGSGVTQPVSQVGTWTVARSWALGLGTDSVNAAQSGTWTTGRTWTLLNSTDSVNAVQSGTWNINNVSGTVSLPTGAATSANQSTEITALQLIDDVPTAMNGAFVKGNPAMGQLDDTSTTAATEDNLAPWRITAQRAGHVNLRNASGTEIGTSGAPVRVDPTGTTAQPVTQSTSPWVTSDLADGSASGGTVAGKSILIGGQFNTTLPNLTTGQQAAIQIDANGRIVTSAITGFGAAFSFGDVSSSATTTTPVRRTAYTEPASTAAFSIKSASANDTAAGTGARTVTVTYMDSSYVMQTETVTLNGTACVNSVTTTARFIEKVTVVTAGSTGSNVGLLTLYTATACSTTVGTVAATDNQTFWAHHYVPTGKVCNVTGLSVNHNGTTVGSGAVFAIKSLPVSVANAVETQAGDFHRLYGQSSTAQRQYLSPIKIAGPARLVVYVTPETSSATVYRASIDYFEP